MQHQPFYSNDLASVLDLTLLHSLFYFRKEYIYMGTCRTLTLVYYACRLINFQKEKVKIESTCKQIHKEAILIVYM